MCLFSIYKAVLWNEIISRDFQPPVFSRFEPIWAPYKQAKIFSNSVSISQYTMQRIRIIVGDAGFKLGTSAPDVCKVPGPGVEFRKDRALLADVHCVQQASTFV